MWLLFCITNITAEEMNRAFPAVSFAESPLYHGRMKQGVPISGILFHAHNNESEFPLIPTYRAGFEMQRPAVTRLK